MDTLLFSERSLWTMLHGVVLGGGSLMALAAALFSLCSMRAVGASSVAADQQARHLATLLVLTAVLLWLALLVGTYITFPPYRAAPPEGLTDLTRTRGPSSIQPRHGVAALVRDGDQGARPLDRGDARYRRRGRLSPLPVPGAQRSAAERNGDHTGDDLPAPGGVRRVLGVFVNKVAPLE